MERSPLIENDFEQILCYLYQKPFPEPHHREIPGMILALLEAWNKMKAHTST